MIDLPTAALIAKLMSDAVGAFDKIFRGYADVVKGNKPTAPFVPPPDYAYVDSPAQKAIVAQSRQSGVAYQIVTYDELSKRLDSADWAYVETLGRTMKNYETQWLTAFEQKSLATGMEIGKMDAQLEYLTKQISNILIKILNFIEKMGLRLDDHYKRAREMAEEDLRKAGR